MKETFLADLEKFFKDQGLSRKEIAEELGVTPSYVSNLLKGKDKFGKTIAQRFSNLYNLNPAWLISEGDWGEMMNPENTTQVYNNVSGHHNTANGICSGNNLCGSSQDEVNAMAAEIERLKAECKHRDELLHMCHAEKTSLLELLHKMVPGS